MEVASAQALEGLKGLVKRPDTWWQSIGDTNDWRTSLQDHNIRRMA